MKYIFKVSSKWQLIIVNSLEGMIVFWQIVTQIFHTLFIISSSVSSGNLNSVHKHIPVSSVYKQE